MNNGVGLDGSLIVLLTFLSGLGFGSITNLLTSVFSAIVVGLIGLAANSLLKMWNAERKSYWRKQARQLAAEKRLLEEQLKEHDTNAAQLSARGD